VLEELLELLELDEELLELLELDEELLELLELDEELLELLELDEELVELLELLEELEELLDWFNPRCGNTSMTLLLPVAASSAVPIVSVPVAAILPDAAA